MKRYILGSFIFGVFSTSAVAQSGTNSPYSQYGLGVLTEQSQGFNRGMNGLSLGLRDGKQVNVMNPASYSAVDSMTMIFDLGMSGQLTNFSENGAKVNAYNADFEYAVGSFRLAKKFGMAFGVIPFTNIGYNYSNTTRVGSSNTTSTETHSGTGGLHQVFVGFGWEPVRNLSVGVNLSYLWGSYDKYVSVSNSDNSVNTFSRHYSTTVNNYKVDFGLQYQAEIAKNNWLTIGATYGLGHKLGADANVALTSTNSQTSVSNTNDFAVEDAYSLPDAFGVGLSWRYKDKLTFGADYSLQKWGKLDFPEMRHSVSGGEDVSSNPYIMKSGLLKDRNRIVVGGEFVPNSQSLNFFNRVHYRLGAGYATPYYTINGQDGPKEYSVSVGFGIPIMNRINNRSILNVSGQWVRSEAKGLITENIFRINVGITFNEQWFMKWKVN